MSKSGALVCDAGSRVSANAAAGKPDHSCASVKGAPTNAHASRSIRVELYGSWRASAAGIIVDYWKRRRGSPICGLARKLIGAGHDPAMLLHIYRGDTLCFRPAPLSRWAAIRAKEGDRECVRFVPHREHPGEKPDSGGREAAFSGHPPFSGVSVPESAI